MRVCEPSLKVRLRVKTGKASPSVGERRENVIFGLEFYKVYKGYKVIYQTLLSKATYSR